jgi:hypothetical protein
MMSLGAISSNRAMQQAAMTGIKSGWKSSGNMIMRNAAIGAGANIALGFGASMMNGQSYGMRDAFRGGLFGAAAGAGGTAAWKLGRGGGAFNNFARQAKIINSFDRTSMNRAMMGAQRWGML